MRHNRIISLFFRVKSVFPKLLVATEFPPNSTGGGAAIVRQMLKQWPPENIFWWSCQPGTNKQFGQEVNRHAVATIPARLNPHRRGRHLKCWLLNNLWVPWAERHLKKTLYAFKPDVIWAIPHCWSIPPLARVLPDAGIDFHVSIHDFQDIRGAVNRFGLDVCRKFSGKTDLLYVKASTRDSICRQMADDLKARTGVSGAITRAGLEEEDFDYLYENAESPENSIHIAYAGTVIAEETFAIFVKALALIRSQLPLRLTLDFFGDHSYHSRSWFKSDWMREHGNLAAGELSQALKKCTWGFAPMELTDDNTRYNRFSLPTKF